MSPDSRNLTFTSPANDPIQSSPAPTFDELALSSNKLERQTPDSIDISTMKTSHPSVLVILLCLALATTYYKVIPHFSKTADYIVSSIESSLQSSLSSPSFCTKEIGEGVCCDLHLGAEPCLDECRKAFMDRQTFQLTQEYEECADQCLVMYRASCGKENVLKERKELWNGDMNNEGPALRSRRRRQARV